MSLKFSRMQEKKLKRLLVRAFTKKQLLIFESISEDKSRSITSASKKISEEIKIPLSTVKLDLKILEQLGLIRIIERQGFKKFIMTKFGKMVIRILSYYSNLTNMLTRLVESIVKPFSIIQLAG